MSHKILLQLFTFSTLLLYLFSYHLSTLMYIFCRLKTSPVYLSILTRNLFYSEILSSNLSFQFKFYKLFILNEVSHSIQLLCHPLIFSLFVFFYFLSHHHHHHHENPSPPPKAQNLIFLRLLPPLYSVGSQPYYDHTTNPTRPNIPTNSAAGAGDGTGKFVGIFIFV